jgi:hypothetical protein
MQIAARASALVAAPPETVYDYAIQPANFPRVFRGYGPIPAMNTMTLLGGARELAVGVERDVAGADGSLLRERITRLERGRRYDYAIVGGLARPLALLVRGADVRWEFSPEGGGTRIRWRYDWRLTSPLAYPAAFVVTRFLQKAMAQCLARIGDAVAGQ